jgi:hypothetical protein
MKPLGVLFGVIAIAGAAIAETGEAATAGRDETSTPEERARVAALTRELEERPFGDEPRELRGGLYRWWTAVPDIGFKWCEPLLLDVEHVDEEFGTTLLLQAVLSGGAFLIENPERASDRRAIWIAGIEGALRLYKRGVTARPELRNPVLDGLVQLQGAGSLADYVDRHAAACE